jgi:hypothetical protein
MKKVVYILVAIFTFSVGYGLYQVRPFVTSVPICEVTQNIGLYNNREVHIKAFLEVSGEYISIDDGCINEDISVDLAEELKGNATITELFKQLRQARSKNSHPMIKAEIIGTIKDIRNDGITGIIDPQFEIKIREIKPISKVVFITDREQLKRLLKD